MTSSKMGQGVVLIFLASVYLAVGAPQNSVNFTQMMVPSLGGWHNETCEDICRCLDGIMKGLKSTQLCMEIRGYPCHLMKQLRRASADRKCSVPMPGTWFECDNGKTECAGGNISVGEKVSCNEENGPMLSNGTNDAFQYLGCETTVGGGNSSVTCVISRDRGAVGQCVNKAECHYKKVNKTSYLDERVLCPDLWKPFRRHCLSPSGLSDQQNWYAAQNSCRDNWDSPLLSIESFSGDEVNELQSKEIINKSEGVWLGLYRNNNNIPFQWADQTNITGKQDDLPWADGHPVNGYDFVYLLNHTLYSAEPSLLRRYSCKMRVSKSLKCRQPQPTESPLPTELGDVETTTLEVSTTQHKKTKKPINALREELTQVREDVSNYLASFTNDTSVIGTVDNLILVSGPQANVEDTNLEEKSRSIEKSLDALVDSLAELIVGPAKPLVVSTPEIVLKVVTLCMDCDEGEALGGQLGNQTFSLTLPDSVKTAGATLALSSARLLNEELPTTIEDENEGDKSQNTIGSLVSTISLRRWDGKVVILTKDAPLQLTFSNLEPIQKSAKASCRYWKVSDGNEKGVWSSEGCNLARSNDTHTVCHMTHLTSFAVIMQIYQLKELPKSLDYLTWAGCALSITCLAIMLIIFLTQKMYRADRNIIHMNLAVSLMISQLIFVFGIDRTEPNNPQGVCKTVGVLLHFFLLATFFWMMNEGIFLLSKTTSAKTRWLRLPTYITVGWVFPLIIVGITMAASFDSYDTVDRCWLTVSDGGIWAFVAPAAAVIMINICIIIQVIRVFLSLRANMNKKKVERIRIALRAILLTLPLLGCTWLIGLLSFNAETLVFAYIFVVMNSLQGVFIFILYCLLNDEIKNSLRKRLALLQSLSGRTSNTRASRTATGNSNNHHQANRLSKTQPDYQEAVKL